MSNLTSGFNSGSKIRFDYESSHITKRYGLGVNHEVSVSSWTQGEGWVVSLAVTEGSKFRIVKEMWTPKPYMIVFARDILLRDYLVAEGLGDLRGNPSLLITEQVVDGERVPLRR